MYDEIGLGLRVGLRRSPAPAGRNVCKWTVVRVEKQAAWCRQIGSFPWWPWQIGLPTARLWTSLTFAVFWRIELKFVALESWKVPLFHSVIFIGKRWGLKNHPWSPVRESWEEFERATVRTCRKNSSVVSLCEGSSSSRSAMLQIFCRGFLLFLCVYTSGVFHTFLYIRTKVWKQSNWMKITPIEAFYVEKAPKKWTKVFAEGLLLYYVL